ncbi:MAG: hypothetical protein PHY16_01310 [Methylobacter sp.]|nr:hypothetical protein [Methylobacter sp.]
MDVPGTGRSPNRKDAVSNPDARESAQPHIPVDWIPALPAGMTA